MATTPTQDAVPSESPRDLKFNAGKIDEFVTSLAMQYIDRFGQAHYTIEGINALAMQVINQLGWIPFGTFQDGATLTNPNQTLKDNVSGEYYRWDGTLPKTVPTGSTPGNSGGVGVGAWVSVGDSALRSMLASDTGAGLVGTESGETVQSYLDGLSKETGQLINTVSSWPPDFTKKTLYKTLPLYSRNWEEIKTTWGYSYLYPQGFAFDDVSNELLVMYTAVYEGTPGSGTALRIFIDIYNDEGAYQQTVCAGFGYAEGAILGYVSGARRIMLAGNGANAKLGVYSLPTTALLSKYQELTKVFDTDTAFGTQVSSNGKYSILLDYLLATTRKGSNLCAYSVHLTTDLLSSASAPTVRKSVIYLPAYCTHGPTSDITPKLQGVCLTPHGVLGIGGSQWYPTQYGVAATNGLNLQYTSYTANGDVSNNTLLSYDRLKDFMDSKDLPVSFFEPEGIVYHKGLFYSLIAHANPAVNPSEYPGGAFSLFIEGVCNEKEGATLDLIDSASKGAFSKGYSVKACASYPVNSRDGSIIDTADKAVQYMIDNHIDELKFAVGVFGSTFSVTTASGAVTYATDGQVKVSTADWNWFNIDVTNTSTGVILDQFRASTSLASPWAWTKNPVFYGGSATITSLPVGVATAALQIGASGSITRRVVSSAAVTVENYYLTTSASIVGGITVNAAGTTTFSTTSDERRKNLFGVNEDVAEKIEKAVDDGAAQLASFKENDDQFYMMIAQALHKHFPQAVVVGGDDEKEEPWMVDSSFVVPAMMIAISQLTKRVKELESK